MVSLKLLAALGAVFLAFVFAGILAENSLQLGGLFVLVMIVLGYSAFRASQVMSTSAKDKAEQIPEEQDAIAGSSYRYKSSDVKRALQSKEAR